MIVRGGWDRLARIGPRLTVLAPFILVRQTFSWHLWRDDDTTLMWHFRRHIDAVRIDIAGRFI
ncbi:conserved hypothetical protein [Ricinus communis]|uniref:Uncharacterized protein n=1 Tax=Ricinus communis TaxID=3988 RepID=B9TAD9_RICCO|nr:conserved hypothetical protein [Ricinus communis]